MIASAIAGGIKGVADVGIGIFNAVQQQKQFEYQKKLQQQIFQREDSAVQRRVADLEKAGLSPVLAASGAGAGAGQVVSTKAPQYEGGDPASAVMEAMMASKSLKAKDAEISLLKSQKKHVDAETKTEDDLRASKVAQASHQAGILNSQADVAMYDSATRAEQWERDHPFGEPLPIDKNTPVGKFITPVFQGASYLNNIFDKAGKLIDTFKPSSDPVVQVKPDPVLQQKLEQDDLLREKESARTNVKEQGLHSQRSLKEQERQQLIDHFELQKRLKGNRGGGISW